MADVGFNCWLDGLNGRYRSLMDILQGDGSAADKKENAFYPFIDIGQEIDARQREMFEQGELETSDKMFQLNAISALIKYQVSGLFLHDELEEAKPFLDLAMMLVQDFTSNPECIFLAVSILCRRSALLVNHFQFDEAEKSLTEIQRILELFDCRREPCVVEFEHLFLREELREAKMISYVSDGFHVQELNKAFSRALKHYWSGLLTRIDDDEFFVSLEWAQLLIDFFSTLLFSRKFTLAKHILSCVNQLSVEFRKVLNDRIEDDVVQLWKKYHRMEADIYMCWGTYAVYLLDCSKLHLSKNLNESVFSKMEEPAFLEVFNNCKWLPAGSFQEFESSIPCGFASNYDHAMEVYGVGRRALDSALTHYAEKDSIEEYVCATRSIVQLLTNLQAFNGNPHSKCESYGQSAGLIENILEKIVPENNIKLFQELLFEVGECYYHAAKLRREFPEPAEGSTARGMYDNTSAYQAISKFHMLMSSLTDGKELSEMLPKEVVMQTLEAIAYYADSHLLIYGDVEEMIASMHKARNCYGAILEYITKYPLHAMYIHAKLTNIREQFLNLPKAIDDLAEQMSRAPLLS